jgi:hypothetical protein
MSEKAKSKIRSGLTSSHAKGYVGLWFHSLDAEGRIEWQGRIIRRIDATHWAARLHDWFDGLPDRVEIVDTKQMRSFHWYETDDDMRAAYDEFRQRCYNERP